MAPMAGTRWPCRVDEVIVKILLRIFDDLVGVPIRVIDELTQPLGVVENQFVVATSDRRVQIMKKQLDNSLVVRIGHRHPKVPSPSLDRRATDQSAHRTQFAV
jgi:hypothetical protein